MANYFYYDADGKQQGPVDIHGLRELVTQGVIVPSTSIKEEGEHSIFAARRIPGLFPAGLFASPSGAIFQPVSLNERRSGIFDRLSGIFDIGFTRFMTNVLIPVFWCIVLVTSFIDYGYGILTAFEIVQPSQTLEALLFTPTRFLLSVIVFQYPIGAVFVCTILLFLNLVFYRVFFELIIVLFRIESHLRAMREKSEEQRG